MVICLTLTKWKIVSDHFGALSHYQTRCLIFERHPADHLRRLYRTRRERRLVLSRRGLEAKEQYDRMA
jgi:hypothetical protein